VTTDELYLALDSAATYAEVLTAVEAFEAAHGEDIDWVPVGGRQNNRGIIEVSGDPGHALIERVTNGIDAVLEDEHDKHDGRPECRTPREAAVAWLNVPQSGLAEMTRGARQALAKRVTVSLLPGDGRAARILEVRDTGIGVDPDQMRTTILSLNESNKMQKHYLAGAYGQGGSATFASSIATLLASRHTSDRPVGFTVVKFRDLPADQYKTGHYVYLTVLGDVLQANLPPEAFPVGTLARHFGYDLSAYDGPVGPNSVYGLLGQVLFDPVMPVWLDNRVRNYRRVIKGARNALNGAVDEGDEDSRGPSLSHRMPMLFVPIGEYGRVGIEYWVLDAPTKKTRRPTAGFVNPAKPIVLTLNGQTHEELSSVLIRKDAELPYLGQRIICHLDCNSLTAAALRTLFVSNREGARRGGLLESIKQEMVNALRSDDELTRLNTEARSASHSEQDQSAIQEARKAVARLLRMEGLNVTDGIGAVQAKEGGPDKPRPRPPHPRPLPQPIELHEPPTYIRIVWSEDDPITFFPEQRRYVRIETDAQSIYHNPNDPAASRINLIVGNGEIVARTSTALQGGRMRALFECPLGAKIGGEGTIRIELSRPGMPVLSDERSFRIVTPPPAKPEKTQLALPPFEYRPVEFDDAMWTTLEWPDDINAIASSAVTEEGMHVVYYSRAFPRFRAQFSTFERSDPTKAHSFETRYAIWLVVHSLLLKNAEDERGAHVRVETEGTEASVGTDEQAERFEPAERVRLAHIAAMVAAREVQSPVAEHVEAE
jgi:hypothetical protein